MGNKTDLQRVVLAEEGMEAAEKIGGYFECSVSQNPGAIDEIYDILVRKVKDQNAKTFMELNADEEETIMRRYLL